MNEAQRQFAMGVAGVRLWYARHPLPGAAPSPDFDYGASGDPAVHDAVVEVPPSTARPAASLPDANVSRQGLARLQGLLAGNSDQLAAKASLERGGSAASTTGKESEAPPLTAEPEGDDESIGAQLAPAKPAESHLSGQSVAFHWRFWVGGRWLLVSNSPDAASRGLEDRLATNILRALGDDVVRTEALRWPVFNNPAVPGNDAAGAVEVVAELAGMVHRTKQLWLGLSREEEDSGETGLTQLVSAPLGKATVSFPGTLAALSSDPAAKRKLWQALQRAECP